MPVLGKRTRNTSPSPTSPPPPTTRIITRRQAAANRRDLLTPEPTPNPKRPRPSSSIVLTPFDDGSNKENIPPKPIDPIVSRSRTQQRILPPPPQPSPPTTPVITHTTRSRAALRAQNHDETSSLIGRDKERDKIVNFLNPFLTDAVNDDSSPIGLYISGAPGTGKTALISELISSISISHGSSIRVISINCMALEDRDLNGVWERCAQELHIARNAKRTSSPKGDWPKQFGKLFDDDDKKCLLVLDEIDNLISPTCPLSDIFDIAAGSTAVNRLRMIGISNTHTLTNAKPIRGVETLHFEPYTAAQMKAVLASRLGTISTNSTTFPTPTIALLCMKVASQTGDIRMLFSVARRALDLAIQGSQASDMPTVNPAHVLTALKVCNASHQGKSGNETVTRVRNLGLQARFALASLLIASRRVASGLSLTGNHSSPNSRLKKENTAIVAVSAIPSIDVTALHGFYMTILGTGAFLGLGRTEFVDLINLLEGNGLVHLGSSRKGKSKGVQTVSLAREVREEELVRGLIGNEGTQLDVKEEEVSHMWHREVARIEREMKLKATSHDKESYFKDAEED